MIAKIRIKKPDDFHVHLRTERTLECVAKFTAKQFKRSLIMPNTSPPILNAHDVAWYRCQIQKAAPELLPLMTIQINGDTTPNMVLRARQAGAIAGKVYPKGVTTNSQNGVADFRVIYPVLEAMQKVGIMVLSLCGEDPWEKATCLHREKMFLPTLFQLAGDFPELRIVLEHITTADAVAMIERLPANVAATITAHHLLLTIDDVIGDLICPHNFCKPVAKFPGDRDALLKAATGGNPKFFFGSDSAPHLRKNKECSSGCAGVFSAPVALPLLTQIFDQHDALDKLEGFTAEFGADFYRLPQNTETIALEKCDWTVPRSIKGIVPFMAGQTLHWQIAE